MSAHNVLQEQLVADHSLVGPVNADDKVQVDRSPAYVAAGVDFFLSEPQSEGERVTIYATAGCSLKTSNAILRNAQSNSALSSKSLTQYYVYELISVRDIAATGKPLVWKCNLWS